MSQVAVDPSLEPAGELKQLREQPTPVQHDCRNAARVVNVGQWVRVEDIDNWSYPRLEFSAQKSVYRVSDFCSLAVGTVVLGASLTDGACYRPIVRNGGNSGQTW
jgi:hypothetical protein